ncbi:MAG: hypothetical protein R3B47_20835 [Bacteroidia bacterium]
MRKNLHIALPGAGWLFLAALALIMLVFQLVQQHWLLSDSGEYLLASENLFKHGTLYCGDLDAPFRTDYLSKRPALYPVILGISPSIPFLLIIQNLLFALNLWIAWKLYRMLRPGGNGLPFFSLLAVSFSVFIYPNLVMTEVWLQSLLLGATWSLVMFWLHGKNKHVWWVAALIGISVWLKPVTWPLAMAMLLLLPVLVFVKRKKISLRVLVISALAPACALGLGGMNYARTGSFHMSSITSINLLQYNAYYTLLRAEGEAAADLRVDSIAARANKFERDADRQDFIRREAMKSISQHPGTYAALHLKGMVHFFLDPGRFDLYHFFGWKSEGGKNTGLLARFSSEGYGGIWAYLKSQGLEPLLLLGLSFLGKIATLAGIVLACWKMRRQWMLPALLLAIPAYLALATGPLGASRFAVPVVPILIVIAAAGFGKNDPPNA